MRKNLRWILLVGVIVLLLAGAGFVVWASTTPAPMATAVQALQSDGEVTITTADWLVFRPVESEPAVGYIFYPGGRVAPESYAPYARALAQAGYLVVIVPMPLNLAVFGIERADGVLAAFPEITDWVIGGHSLGGSMAARYAFDHPDQIAGLVLLASYPEADRDFSARDIVAASIYGTLDGLASVQQVESTRTLFPDEAQFIALEGGNHAQFGDYGDQAGDNPATITREAQQAQAVEATLAILQRIEGGA